MPEMTNEERAREIVAQWYAISRSYLVPEDRERLADRITSALDAATAREKERCAGIVAARGDKWRNSGAPEWWAAADLIYADILREES